MQAHPVIALMPPDVRYYLLTAGGVPQPNAEWTEAAQNNFLKATLEYAQDINADLRVVEKNDLSDDEIRYEALHATVGSTILNNYFGPAHFKLPAKGDRFDWSLGPGVSAIGDRHGADYALFVFYRDYQASGGRVAMSILTAVVAGVATSTGAEIGFASLVDLRTGDIVWFNVVSAGQGELNNAAEAGSAVRYLFQGIPAGERLKE